MGVVSAFLGRVPRPERLHDSRWLGRDKREREKINRRKRNALAKVNRLPPLERQAVLDALLSPGEV